MVMFYHRIIIIIFCSYIFGYLPSEPTLSNYTNQSRIDIQGWPSLGIIDLEEGQKLLQDRGALANKDEDRENIHVKYI